MKISEIFTYFTDTIFRRDINEWRNPVIRWLVQQYRLLFYTCLLYTSARPIPTSRSARDVSKATRSGAGATTTSFPTRWR